VKFNTKNYKKTKTSCYIKTNKLIFLFNGVNKNSIDWIYTEQSLKKMNFKYYKILNKTVVNTLKESIYRKVAASINGLTFFIKPGDNLQPLSTTLPKDFDLLLFLLLALKLNKKMYSASQIEKSSSLNYKNNKLLVYQFGLTHLKFFNSFNISK
jgi:hypothetical protein